MTLVTLKRIEQCTLGSNAHPLQHERAMVNGHTDKELILQSTKRMV